MPKQRQDRILPTIIVSVCGLSLVGCSSESNVEDAAPPALSIDRSAGKAKPVEYTKNGKRPRERTPEENQKLADEIALLIRDAQVSGYDISIEVKDANVKLLGTIPSKAMEHQVIEAIKSHSGVESIDCQLAIEKRDFD